MSDDGKIPSDNLNPEEWVISEASIAEVIQSSLQAEHTDALGEEPAPTPDPRNPWVDAGAAAVVMILNKLLDTMGSGTVKIAMAVNNFTGYDLVSPKYALYSGSVVDTALYIPKGKAGFFTAQKNWGTYGTFGVLTYDLQGTDRRLAIMWSIPHSMNVASQNYFKLSVISNKTPANPALYDDMLWNQHKLTIGDCAAAANGSDGWTNGDYRLEGVMGTASICTLNSSLKQR